MTKQHSRLILPVIVVAQFLSTSIWFAGNSIVSDIVRIFQFNPGFVAHLTSVVQFGFITGTLVFALFTIADRFSPSLVFFVSAIVAALFNLAIILPGIHSTGLLVFRFLTGFFLAGIYPVGMKIASDYYQKGLGKSLGFLVGALVLGTAFPHFIKTITAGLPWRYVIFYTSALSAAGGLILLLLVPDGPYRKQGPQLNISACLSGFANKNFRAAAFGYFGHMWELYAFWAFVPAMLTIYKNHFPQVDVNVPFWSFLIIGSGAIACICSGILSQYFGVKRIAAISLSLSCLCCFLSPLFLVSSFTVLIIFLLFWGIVVVADSPLFSTMVAQNAPEESRGTSLTIVNCIGFSITIISIQLINVLSAHVNSSYLYMVLAIGPVFGLIALLAPKRPVEIVT